MQKSTIAALFATTAIIAAATTARADEMANIPVYGELKMGASIDTADGIKNTSNVSGALANVNQTSGTDTTGVFGAAVGLNLKKWGAPVRAEVEYAYRTDFNYNPNPNFVNAALPSKSTNSVTTQTLLVNGFYDFDTGTKFTPFVGAGIGAAFLNTSTKGTVISTGATENVSNSRTNFAWSVGAGVNYAIDTHWSADLAYRYLDLGSVDFGNTVTSASKGQMTGDFTAHEVLAGLRYQF